MNCAPATPRAGARVLRVSRRCAAEARHGGLDSVRSVGSSGWPTTPADDMAAEGGRTVWKFCVRCVDSLLTTCSYKTLPQAMQSEEGALHLCALRLTTLGTGAQGPTVRR